jgi:hypothetical protein
MFPMMTGMGNGLSLENPTKVVALTEVIFLILLQTREILFHGFIISVVFKKFSVCTHLKAVDCVH